MNQDGALQQIVQIAAQSVAAATPYLYAGLGEAVGQRAGVYNLGVDGIMLMGAFTAFYVAYVTESLALAILLAALVGALMGLLMAFISVTLHAEQGISGIGVYIFGLGLSTLLFDMLVKSPFPVSGFRSVPIPLLSEIPILGPMLFKHDLMVYGALLLTPIMWFVLNKTTLGLNIRAVGQNPQAADSLGVNVALVRYLTVIFGGLMAGIGGAALSTALTNIFQPNMTNGIGFIAVALVYFGGWSPFGILFGALLFSMFSTLNLWLQAFNIQVSPSLTNMLPNVATIVALVLAVRFYRTSAPAALGRPYRRGEN
jgi:general nucleoside transport system permease protein